LSVGELYPGNNVVTSLLLSSSDLGRDPGPRPLRLRDWRRTSAATTPPTTPSARCLLCSSRGLSKYQHFHWVWS
jgi:hypothetical protein